MAKRYAAHLLPLLALLVLASLFLSEDPCIVVTGGVTSDSDFLPKIRSALEAEMKGTKLDLLIVDDANDRIKSRLRGILARRKVAGIICASTSDRSLPIIRISEALQIPTVLVVATKPGLARPPHVLSYMPDDREQAGCLRSELSREQSPVVMITSPTSYGRFLSSELERTSPHVIRAELSHALSPVALSAYFDRFRARTFLLLGYADEMRPIVRQLEVLSEGRPTNVILSDGASSLMNEIPRSRLRLSAVQPVPKADDQKRGHSAYTSAAIDACKLMINAHKEGLSREELLKVLTDKSRALTHASGPRFLVKRRPM